MKVKRNYAHSLYNYIKLFNESDRGTIA